MLIDTHAHYMNERFDEDRDALLASLPLRGVSHVILASTTLEDTMWNLALAKKYSYVYSAAGIYPHDCGDMTLSQLDAFYEFAKDSKMKAIGETGLDYYYDTVSHEKQKLFFARQLELASELSLPVIVHDRDAHQDCLDMISKYASIGVFHCYTGSAEYAREVVARGYYISFSGSLTFKNASKLLRAAQEVPLDRLLVETDCPYLTPTPFRGKRNDSTYMEHTAHKLAQLRGLSFEELSRITTENAKRLFAIE